MVQFTKILEVIKMDERKEGMNRRKFTFHSFRRNAYITICDATDQAFAEYFLGHSKSVYHTKKQSSKREIYATKIMKYLTFLNFEQLETTGKNIEAKLEEKDREIAYLSNKIRERDAINADTINNLSDKLMEVTSRLDKLEER